jgi:hypothetical protein
MFRKIVMATAALGLVAGCANPDSVRAAADYKAKCLALQDARDCYRAAWWDQQVKDEVSFTTKMGAVLAVSAAGAALDGAAQGVAINNGGWPTGPGWGFSVDRFGRPYPTYVPPYNPPLLRQ